MKKVDILRRRRVFDDIFKIDEAELRFERYNGEMSPPVRRLSFERGESVAAVVWRHDTDDLLFAEQFRYPTLERGPGWLLEIMAGVIDAGETPEAAVRREIDEELGYRIDRVEPVATFYVSPGGSSERIWLYFVDTTQASRASTGGGSPAENEDIRVVTMPRDAVRRALDEGRFTDAKTIIGLQWFFSKGLRR
jgi:nudix-type nucleoside diphosphatase (YffH/AdpP family)